MPYLYLVILKTNMEVNNKKPVVLSAHLLDVKHEQVLTSAGIELIQKEFVSYSIQYDRQAFLDRLNDPDTQARVFTSKASVRSLADLLELTSLELIPKKTFTVGIKATEMLKDLGVEVAARSNNALSLAQVIARNSEIKSIDFFCGNHTLNDLPEYLESKGIKVYRSEIFEITMTSISMDLDKVNSLIFCTPSAVYSFFGSNKPDTDLPVFCIGETTAEAVHYRCDNPKFVAGEPTLDSLMIRVADYYSK